PARRFSYVVYGLGRDPLHFLSSPFDLLVRGDKFDQGWSIGPAYLAFVPLAVLWLRSRLAKLLAAYLIVWWIIWFYSSPQPRILLPILPAAAGLAAVAIDRLMRSP